MAAEVEERGGGGGSTRGRWRQEKVKAVEMGDEGGRGGGGGGRGAIRQSKVEAEQQRRS